MPVTYYTEQEVDEYKQLLAECYKHISEGSATELSRNRILGRIAKQLGTKMAEAHDRVMQQAVR